MSFRSLRILFPILVVVASGLGLGTAEAGPSRVDLSEFVESPGERVPLKSTPDPVSEVNQSPKKTAKKAKKAKKAKGGKAAKKAKRAARKRK